jgi:type IV pilus assembly protein PilP
MLHYVTLGNYVGQNFGKITAITETDLTLREIVQDAAGEWVERSMTLQLQETAQ